MKKKIFAVSDIHGNYPALINALEEKINTADEISEEFFKAMFKEIQKEHGIKGKNLFMPIRVVTTGQTHGPELADAISLIGKEKVIARVEKFAN